MGEGAPQAGVLAAGLGEITADVLRATFDHWRIFGKDGCWWAMRAGLAAVEGPRSLIRPVVCAMTLDRLAEQLSLQEWLRRMSAAELEAVWHDGFRTVPESAHPVLPQPGTCYRIGPNGAGRRADMRNALDYPVEGVCLCGQRIVCDRVNGEWYHEPRPDEP